MNHPFSKTFKERVKPSHRYRPERYVTSLYTREYILICKLETVRLEVSKAMKTQVAVFKFETA
jgi:hypothetical protein